MGPPRSSSTGASTLSPQNPWPLPMRMVFIEGRRLAWDPHHPGPLLPSGLAGRGGEAPDLDLLAVRPLQPLAVLEQLVAVEVEQQALAAQALLAEEGGHVELRPLARDDRRVDRLGLAVAPDLDRH